MVATVTGNSLGLSLTSLATLNGQGSLGTAGLGRSGEGVYVNTATGNLVVQDRDGLVVSRGFDALALRTYNSQGLASDDNKDNWSNGIYAQQVKLASGTLNAAGSTLVRTDRDGAQATYTYNATLSAYVTTDGAGASDRIVYETTSGGRFTWTDGDSGLQERYDATGKITSSIDPLGGSLTYAYTTVGTTSLLSSVSAASGEKLLFIYAAGTTNLAELRTVRIDDPLQPTVTTTLTRVRYTYNNNRLETVTVDLTPDVTTDSKTYVTTYAYTDATSTRIKTITQTDGSEVNFVYTQVPAGGAYRVTQMTQTSATGVTRVTSFLYDTVNRKTTVTDPLLNATVYTYDATPANRLLSVQGPLLNGVAQTFSYAYNASGDLTSQTDAQGNVTTYSYDANGNQTSSVDTLGNTVTRTFSAANKLLTETLSSVPVLVAGGSLTLIGGTATKTGTTNAFDAGFRSENGYLGGASVSFSPAQANKTLIVGLNTDPSTDNAKDSIDWGIYCASNGDLLAYGNGSSRGSLGTYVAGDVLTLTYDGSTMRWFKNGVVVKTSTNVVITQPLYADASLHGAGAQATGIYFGAQPPAAIAPITYSTGGGVTVVGGTVTKTGTTNAFDASVRSNTGLVGPAAVSFSPAQANKTVVVGLNTDPATDDAMTSIDWGLYLSASGTLNTRQNGVDKGSIGTYAAGDVLGVAYDGVAIKYYKNGVVLKTVVVAITQPLYADSSLHGSGLQITGLSFGANLFGMGPPGLPTTRYAYDTNNLLRYVVSPEGRVTEYKYNSYGQRTASIDYADSLYAVSGMASNASPSEPTLSAWRDALTPAQKQATVRVDTTYDFRGQVDKVITYKSVDTSGVGDPLGASTTQYVYDQAGNLLKTIAPQGVATTGVATDFVTQYFYDGLSRVYKFVDALNVTTLTDYQDANARTVITLANGLSTTRTYNKAGEIISTVQGSGAPTSTFINANGITLAGNAATKTGGVEGAWDASVQSSVGFSGGAHVSFSAAQINKDLMVGLTTNPASSNHFDSINWAFFCRSDGTFYVYENGGLGMGFGTYTASDVFSITYDGSTVRYLKNGVVLRSVAVTIIQPLFADSSFATVGAAVTDLKFGELRFINANGITFTGNSATKTGGVEGAWDASVQSSVGFSGGAYVSFSAAQINKDLMVGLTTNPASSNHFDSINWAFFCRSDGTFYVYENGGLGMGFGTYTASDVFSITYDGSTVRYLKNGVVLRSVAVTITQPLYADSSFATVGATVTQLEFGPARLETTFSYDKNGNLKRVTDPTGVSTYSLYDTGGRKVADIDANGSLTEYAYNQNGQVIRTVRYATAVTGAKLTSLNSDIDNNLNAVTLASVRPPLNALADRSTRLVYDKAGRLSKSIDELGFVSETQYDNAGRVLAVVRYDTALPNFASITPATLPTDLLATPATNVALDRRTRFFYDTEGKLTGTLDAEGYLNENQYDSAGRLVHTQRYANPVDASSLARLTGTLNQLRPSANFAKDIHTWTTYNAQNQVLRSLDGEGYLTMYAYDLNGNQTLATRYNKQQVAQPNTFTSNAQLAALVPINDAQDHTSSWTYTDLNQIKTATDFQGTVTQFSYSNVGLLEKTEKAFGTAEVRVLQTRYDKLGRVVGELTAEGSAALAALSSPTAAQINAVWSQYGLTHAYDAAGRRISTTDQNGYKTRFYYTVDGKLAATINALGQVVQTGYNALNQADQTTVFGGRLSAATLATLNGGLVTTAFTNAIAELTNAPINARSSQTYTLRGQVESATGPRTDANNAFSSFTYSAFGELATSSTKIDSAGTLVTTAYTYDRLGQSKTTVFDAASLNIGTSTDYDAFGRAITRTDGNLKSTSIVYDRLGRVVQTTDPLLINRYTEYDAFDRTLSITDGLNNATSFSYDKATRTFTMRTPEGVETVTTANRHGETVIVKNGNLSIASYDYDLNGRLKTKIEDSGAGKLNITTTNNYDRAGRLLDTTLGGTKVAFTYDALDRALTRTVDAVPGGLNLTTVYTYDPDALGQRQTITDPSGVVTATRFDLAGNVTEVAVDPAGRNLRTVYTYDPRGKALTVTQGAGSVTPQVTRYEYDRAGRLLRESRDPAGLNLTVAVYAYDKNNNVVNRTDGNGNLTRYVYDADNRLVYTVNPLGAVTKLEYDNENRVTRSVAFKNPISFTSPTALSLTPSVGDLDGRVTSNPTDEATRTVYDKDGRAVFSIDALGQVTRKTYDKNGNVVALTQFVSPIGTPASWSATDVGTAVTAIANPARDRLSRYAYDAANRLVYSVDALGGVTENFYDAAGHVTATKQYATPLALPTEASTDRKTIVLTGNSGDVKGANYAAIDTTKTYRISVRVRQLTGTGVIYAGVATKDAAGNIITNSFSGTYSYAATANATLTPEMGWVTFEGTISGEQALNAAASPNKFFAGSKSAAPLLLYNYSAGDPSRLVEIDSLVLTEVSSGAVLNTGSDMSSGATSLSVSIGTVAGAYATTPPTLGATDIQGAIRPDALKDRITRYAYDAAGRLSYSVSADGAVVGQLYDNAGKVIQTTAYGKAYAGAADHATLSTYYANAANQTTADRVTRCVYDSAGRRSFEVDAMGGVFRNEYNAEGQVVKTTRFGTRYAGAVTHTALSSFYAIADNQHYLDRDTRLVYDAAGRVRFTIDALGGVVETNYNSLGQVTVSTAWDAKVTPSSITDASTVVDVRGMLPLSTANARQTFYLYDAAGRQFLCVEPSGATTETQYDATGNVTTTKQYATRMSQAMLDALAANPTGAGLNPRLLSNSMSNWTAGVDGDGTNFTRGVGFPDWTLAGEPTLWLRQGGSAAISSYITLDPMAVTAGKRYEVSAYTGAHRATASLEMVFFDAAGNKISTLTPTGGVTTNASEAPGGTALSGYKRLWGFVTAPAGAVSASLQIRKAATTGAQADSYLFVAHATVGEAAVGQTAASLLDLRPVTDSTSLLSSDMSLWTRFVNGPNPYYQLSVLPAASGLSGETTLKLNQNNGASTSAKLMSPWVNVSEGNRYDVSVYTGSARSSVTLQVVFYDAQDNTVAIVPITNGANANAAEKAGGTQLSDYKRLWGSVIAPAGAVSASIQLSKTGSDLNALDSYLTIAHAYFGEAPQDRITSNEYDAAGRLKSTTDAIGNSEFYSYDSLGNKTSLTNKNGAVFDYEYDRAGHLVKEKSPTVTVYKLDSNFAAIAEDIRLETRMGYDAFGDLTSRTEASGRSEQRTTRYSYDRLGRQTGTTQEAVGVYNAAADNLATNGVYNDTYPNTVARTEQAMALSTETLYDVFGQAVINRDVAGFFSYKTYDKLGRLVNDVDANHYATNHYYSAVAGHFDGVTRVGGKVSFADGFNVTAATIDTAVQTAAGAAGTDAARSAATSYDALGRKVGVYDGFSKSDGSGGAYTVDSLTGVGIYGSAQTVYEYNVWGELTRSAQLIDGTSYREAVTRFGYDVKRGVTRKIDAEGYVVDSWKNAFGEESQVTEYAYQTFGATGSVWVAVPKTTATANAESEIGFDRTRFTRYDRRGLVESEGFLDIQLDRVTGNGTAADRGVVGRSVTDYRYDKVGNVISSVAHAQEATYGNVHFGKALTNVYNAVGHLVGTVDTRAHGTVYQRDALGNALVTISLANMASAGANAVTAAPDNVNDQYTYQIYDKLGRVVQTRSPTSYAQDSYYFQYGSTNEYFSYDARGNVAKQWTPYWPATGNKSGNSIQVFSYDAVGQQTKTQTLLQSLGVGFGNAFTYTADAAVYNAFGEVTSKTRDGAEYAYYKYDVAGRVWMTNADDGVAKVYLHDLQGNVVSVITSADRDLYSEFKNSGPASVPTTLADNVRRTSYVYDRRGKVIEQNSLGRINLNSYHIKPHILQTYDAWGNVLSNTSTSGYVSNYRYNYNNLVIEEKMPETDVYNTDVAERARPTINTFYDAWGNTIATRDARGNFSTATYFANGELKEEHHADGGMVRHSYDYFGRETQRESANVSLGVQNGRIYHFTYDRANQLVKETVEGRALSHSDNWSNLESSFGYTYGTYTLATYRYDLLGRRTEETSGADDKMSGETMQYTYDTAGRLISSASFHQPDRTIKWEYNAAGLKSKEIDAYYQITSFFYDIHGRLTSKIDMGGAETTYLYNFAGELISQTSTRGQNLQYTYWTDGLLKTITDKWNDSRTTYDYDPAGNKVVDRFETQVSTATPRVQRDAVTTYDELGRVYLSADYASDHTPGFAYYLRYHYDANGNRHRITGYADDRDYTGNTSAPGVLPAARTDADGLASRNVDITYGYDTMNQVTSTKSLIYIGTPTAPFQAYIWEYMSYDLEGMRISHQKDVVNTVVIPVTPGILLNRRVDYEYDFAGRVAQTFVTAQLHLQTAPQQRRDHRKYLYDAENGYSAEYEWANQTAADSFSYIDKAPDRVFIKGMNYNRAGQVTGIGNSVSKYGSDVAGTITSQSNYYDTVGNLVWSEIYSYKVNNAATPAHEFLNTTYESRAMYQYSYLVMDGYRQRSSSVQAWSGGTAMLPNKTTLDYDVNGQLLQTYADDGSQKQFLVTDNSGRIVRKFSGLATPALGEHAYADMYEPNKPWDDFTQSTKTTALASVSARELGFFQNGGTPHQRLFFASDRLIGVSDEKYSFSGGVAKLDMGFVFDEGWGLNDVQAFDATGFNYTVQADDTLRSLAQTYYGDATLWYVIAEANAIAAGQALVAGQQIRIPTVTRSTNSANTYQQYKASQVIDNTNPSPIAPPPPPPPRKKAGCGAYAKALVAVIASAVAIYYAGAYTQAPYARMGNALGQIYNMKKGNQEDFDFRGWNHAGAYAANNDTFDPITASTLNEYGRSRLRNEHFDWKRWRENMFVTYPIQAATRAYSYYAGGGESGVNSFWAAVSQVAVSTAGAVATEYGRSLIYDDYEVNWRNVAVAAASATVSLGLNQIKVPNPWGLGDLTKSVVSGTVSQLIANRGKVDWAKVGIDSFGNVLGRSLVDQMLPKTTQPSGPSLTDAELFRREGLEIRYDEAELYRMQGFDPDFTPLPRTPVYHSADDTYDSYDLMGNMPGVGTVGKEGAQGAWGIAKSLAGANATDPEINRIKNQLLTLNPELANGVEKGQRYYLPSADTPENLTLARSADRPYQAGLAARSQLPSVAWGEGLSSGGDGTSFVERAAPGGESSSLGAPTSLRGDDSSTLRKIFDGTEATYRYFVDKPILGMGAKIENWLGVDWGTQSKLDETSREINNLLDKSYGGQTASTLSYSAAMNMSVSAIGSDKYDTTNITHHQYRFETELCYRQEPFCTIPNLSPLVNYRSAPLQSWSGGVQDGTQELVGWNPVVHTSNFNDGMFVNQTLSDHGFHNGTVENNLYWKGDVLTLTTSGYGYGATPLHTAANYMVGEGYFRLWQTAVKYNVNVIRQSQVEPK